VQNLRVEQAKRLLESARLPVDGVSAAVGYEDASFFRRLFRRRTGLSPAAYRRMFGGDAEPTMTMRASVPRGARGSSESRAAGSKPSRRRSATFASP